jgi:hypothetical protein
VKMSFKNQGEIKIFRQTKTEFTTSRLTLGKILKGSLESNRKKK